MGNFQKGFAWLPALFIILGLIVVGGGAYYFGNKNTTPVSDVKNNGAELSSLSGECTHGSSNVPADLLKLQSNSSATFSCILHDGSFVVGGEGKFWSHNFRVVHFDRSGTVLHTFSKDNGNASGGEFEVSDVANGVFSLSDHVVDPCYDATFTFTFDLKTGEYTEAMKGGDDAACWKKLNAQGGV
jgi:hypothetical protein